MNQIPFKNYVSFALTTNLIALILVIIFQRFLPPLVPLFYGLPVGEEQLVPSWVLIVPILVSILIISANVSGSLLVKDEFLKKTLVLGGILINVLSIVTTVRIILLVGSF